MSTIWKHFMDSTMAILWKDYTEHVLNVLFTAYCVFSPCFPGLLIIPLQG